MSNQALLKLKKHFTNWSGVSRALKVSRSYIICCRDREGVSALRAIMAERKTGGDVKAYDLLTPEARKDIDDI